MYNQAVFSNEEEDFTWKVLRRFLKAERNEEEMTKMEAKMWFLNNFSLKLWVKERIEL